MEINEVIELDIEKLDHQGRGIAHFNNNIYFIENALPGEKVFAKIDKIKKNIIVGHTEKIITISKDRIDSICPYFELCGGCDLLHLSYTNQLLFKENKIREIMGKFCSYEFKINPIIKCDNIFNYRNKVTFQIDNCLGFYEKETNNIVPIKECKIVNQKVNELIEFLNKQDIILNSENVVLRSNIDDELMLIINSKSILDDSFKNEISKYVKTFIFNNNIIFGDGTIIEKLNNYNFIISPLSFFQVNTNQTIKLYNKIKEYASLTKDDVLLDLYCGTGTIGIYLSSECKKVLGIEINKSAIRDANENKVLNNIDNIDFICGDALKEIKRINIKPSVIVVDPPRAGLDKKDIDNIFKLGAERIVYVSCDPVTLARDLNILGTKYNIIELTPVDMFPNTNHVESVCYMLRKDIR